MLPAQENTLLLACIPLCALTQYNACTVQQAAREHQTHREVVGRNSPTSGGTVQPSVQNVET
jgi:hypothetical protein